MIDKKKFAIWGDSVLKGIILNKQGRYEVFAENCAREIERKHGLKIENRARFGCTITKGMKQLERALAGGLDCDCVLLEYGGNDCDFDWKAVSDNPEQEHQPRTRLEDFIRVYEEMILLLKKHAITPIIVSLPPINGRRYLDYLAANGLSRENLLRFLGEDSMIYRFQESYSLAVTSLAHRLGCIYAPVREAFLKQKNQPDYVCEDGIHPNENGHKLMLSVFESMALVGAIV